MHTFDECQKCDSYVPKLADASVAFSLLSLTSSSDHYRNFVQSTLTSNPEYVKEMLQIIADSQTNSLARICILEVIYMNNYLI